MKSMFDPYRPAVFKAVSLSNLSRKAYPKVSLLTLAAPLFLSGGCQSNLQEKQDIKRFSRLESSHAEHQDPLNSSPLNFANPFTPRTHREIIIASYNVENLFDQHDDARNESYGDYRISPNQSGQASNYGDAVTFQSRKLTFTDVKIQGIRKTLTGIGGQGPDIIGLIEVESQNVLDQLLQSVSDLGYKTAQFSSWKPGMKPSAIGMGLLSKYPIKSWDLILPHTNVEQSSNSEQGVRPILKVVTLVDQTPLIVYVNHWKSKSAPESSRIAYAKALEADLLKVLKDDPNANYIILGDLNSAYNEKEIIEPNHNDSDGITGINDILKAGSNKKALSSGDDPHAKYNLVFEAPEELRGSAWYPNFGWSSLDHIIIGPALFDGEGLDYVDGSFAIADAQHDDLQHLFTDRGVPNRWHSKHRGKKFTAHEPGGFSDHLPLWAKFVVQ